MGIVLKNVNITGGKMEALSKPIYSSEWIRNPDWLPLPDILSTDDEIVALWAVFDEPTNNNFACFNITSSNGFFEVNHGDGSGWITFANGTSFYQYDYNNINLHSSSLPYKQAIIRIRATSGGVITACNFNSVNVSSINQQVNTRYHHNFLELKLSMPNASTSASIVMPQSSRRASLLEHIEILNIGNCTTFAGAFQNNRNLVKITISANTSGITSLASAFRDCPRLSSLPDMDTSNVTTMNAMARNCVSLIDVPNYDTSNVVNFNFTFLDCRSLVKLPPINIQSATNISGMFVDAQAIEKVEFLNGNIAPLTLVSAVFARCFSLQEAPFFNTTNVANFQDIFVSCFSLRTIPNYNMQNATNISHMFNTCQSMRIFPDFNTQNQTTFPSSTTNSFINCANLVWIDMIFRSSINLSNCRLNREALIHIFNNLFDRTSLTAANINISGNPGAISTANGGLTTAERAIALNKNWTITG